MKINLDLFHRAVFRQSCKDCLFVWLFLHDSGIQIERICAVGGPEQSFQQMWVSLSSNSCSRVWTSGSEHRNGVGLGLMGVWTLSPCYGHLEGSEFRKRALFAAICAFQGSSKAALPGICWIAAWAQVSASAPSEGLFLLLGFGVNEGMDLHNHLLGPQEAEQQDKDELDWESTSQGGTCRCYGLCWYLAIGGGLWKYLC